MACTHTADRAGKGGLEKRESFSPDQRECVVLDFLASTQEKCCRASSASSTSLVWLLLLLLRHSFTLFQSFDPPGSPQPLLIPLTLLSDVLLGSSKKPVRPPLLWLRLSQSRGGGVLAVTLAGGAHVMSSELLHATTAGVHLWICCHLVNNVHAALKYTLEKELATCINALVPTQSCFRL